MSKVDIIFSAYTTELPMPNQGIAQLHRVLSDQFTDDTDKESDTEIGVFNNQQPIETVAIEEEVEDNTENTTYDNAVMPPENDETQDQTENHIPDNTENESNTEEEIIEHEKEMSKERITIDDINIMKEMNTSHLAILQQEETTANQPPTHGYNLRECPTRGKSRYHQHQKKLTKSQEWEKKGNTCTQKLYAHVILTQLNIREGLLAFREKGNEAVLKELSQLHEKKALMPVQKTDMTYDEGKRL